MAKAGNATDVDSLDEQISALLESVGVERPRLERLEPPAPQRRTVSSAPELHRASHPFRVGAATRELAYFVIAGLMIGALIGVLIALLG